MAKLIRYNLMAALCTLMWCSCLSSALGQETHRLIIRSINRDSAYFSDTLRLRISFQSSRQALDYVNKLGSLLQSKGYISASIDSIVSDGDQTTAYLFLGENYGSLQLYINPGDADLLQRAGWQTLSEQPRHLSFDVYHNSQKKLLDYLENNGYPFAKVYLDSISINSQNIEARLKVDKGILYRIDSIRLYGPAKLSRNFIHRYLNIERSDLYQKEKLEKINQRLLELPYLQQMRPWDLTMLNTGTIVNLYLQPKRSNQVNVLAGFLPSNQQVGGKLLLTVDANLQLQNAFAHGERVELVWQQIQPKSPRLHLRYAQPYLFNSPFGVDLSFELFKKDSTFLNINGQVGLLYMLSANKTVKVALRTHTTNVLQVDTFRVRAVKRLPDIADVRMVGFGVDYEVTNTDYRFNPRRGNELTLSVSAGKKTVRKNALITQIKDPAFNYNRLYDSVGLNTYQLRLRLNAAQYVRVGKQSVIKLGTNAGWYESPNFFRNELFQIGGYKLLRGFDEESIYVNQYAVGTIEYRYLFGLNSNFFVFSDFGWTSNKLIKQFNRYLSAGVGISFETKGGIFNLSYAAGKRSDVNFDIRQSKIHFGYVSVF